MRFINQEENDIKNISRRIKRKDFSGNSGQVLKNSIYQSATNFISKLGSFILTMFLARALMPELFGLYNLAMGTIILFFSFTNIGTGKAILKFVSNSLGKKRKGEAKSYLTYIIKIQIVFFIVVAAILALSSKFLAEVYYQKPIFLALLAGCIYMLFSTIQSVIETILQASNNFKTGFFREIFFQFLRLILLPLAVLITLKSSSSQDFILFILVLAMSLLYFLSSIFLILFAKKDLSFLKSKAHPLSRGQKTNLNHFLVAVSIMIFSGIFLGQIDMIMLGHFVKSEFIGFYGAAFSVVGTFTALLPFSLVLFPVFSRIKGKVLKNSLRKSVRITFLISLILSVFCFFTSPIIIKIIYGGGYLSSINLLRVLSLLILSTPVVSIYESYFISQGKQKVVALLLIGTTVLNLGLNYFLIVWLLNYSQLAAIYGASIATILSRFFYLFLLMFTKRKVL